MRLKKGDKVIVIAGKEKGKEGEIKRVVPKENKVIVDGLNKIRKHVKPNQVNTEGKIEIKEAPIHVSNVALKDPKTKKATKIKYEIVNGKKVRVTKSSKTTLK